MKKYLHLQSVAAVLCSVAFATPAVAQAKPLYHLVQTIPLGGGIKWDYLHFDAPTDRVYVSHGTEVTVVDAKTGKVIGELKNLPGSHGIAVDPATGDVYADSAANRVAVAFDPRTFAPIASAPVVLDADGMVYDPYSKEVFVNGGDGKAMTPIDPATDKASPDIALGGSPEFLAPDGAGSLFVNITDENEIAQINTPTQKIVARLPLGACEHPKGLALDPATHLLFSSCANGEMAVLNAHDGALIKNLPIGMGTDAAAVDPVRHRVFSSNGDGTLTVVSDVPGHVAVLGTVKTEPGARTLAVDPASGRIYLVTATVTERLAPKKAGGPPRFKFAPGSLRLLVYAPGRGSK
jgi:DNA-binding beta-propeller fold protein YncE